MAYKQISPQSVAEGGTGAQTLTGVLTGNGTSAISANAITQYKVLVGGASNAVSEVASVGTSGQVLTSNGPGVAPTFQDQTGNSGSLIFLATKTASASSEILFTSLLSATYTTYFFTYSNVVPSVDADLYFEVSDDNGSSYITTGYLTGSFWNPYDSVTKFVTTHTTKGQLCNGIESTSSYGASGNGYIYNIGNSQQFMSNGDFVFYVNGASFGKGRWTVKNSSTSINAFRVYPLSGTLTTGTFSLYGVVQ